MEYNSAKKSAIILISPLNSIILEQTTRYGTQAVEIGDKFLSDLKIHQSVCSSMSMTPSGDATSRSNCICPDNIKQFSNGNFLYLIGHPEKLMVKHLFREFRQLEIQITHIVVDEAHCIEKWGDEFRKDFSKLKNLRSILPKAKILALTGTAGTETQKAIKSSLLMRDCVLIQTCVARRNIKLSVKRRPNYSEGSEESFLVTLKPFIDELKEKKRTFPKTVVYCNLKWCGAGYEQCVRELPANGRLLAAQYHSPCTNEMKEDVIKSMAENGKTRLLFATEAYSMGTDTPNIRRIVHFGVPKSVESYIQEVGRAGRDGEQAEAILFFNNNDVAKNVKGLDSKIPEYCKTGNCRWNWICHHFGCVMATTNVSHDCCDNCSLRCTCTDCDDAICMEGAAESEEEPAVSSALKGPIILVLQQYFQAEIIF